jgi:hypothetical protein
MTQKARATMAMPARAPKPRPADVENDTKGLRMRSSITSVLVAGAFALAGASSAAWAAGTEVNVTTTGDQTTTIDYKAAREKCKTLPGSDQARCLDQVGVTAYSGEREGTATPEMGSLQGREKCETLSPADKRECLMNDKGG